MSEEKLIWDEFMKVQFEIDGVTGEIKTDRPEYLPMIEEWIKKPKNDPDWLREFIERHSGEWIEL